MEFFNKKEEVLDVQLTEYGKYLLSQGRMKPAFYAFYDDEILYDISASGRTEAQKGADRRIRYETPNLKPQSNTTGVETRVKQYLKNIASKLKAAGPSANIIDFRDAYANTPQFDQKFFVATDPLGTSELISEYDPAWGIIMRHNEIDSSQDYYTVNLTSSAATVNNGVIKEIPQINITMDYQMFYTKEVAGNDDYEIIAPINDEINLALKKDHILIELHEFNTVYEKDNFYLETFLSGNDAGLRQICIPPPPPPPDRECPDDDPDCNRPRLDEEICLEGMICETLCHDGDPDCPPGRDIDREECPPGEDCLPCPDCGVTPDEVDRKPVIYTGACETCGIGPECEDC